MTDTNDTETQGSRATVLRAIRAACGDSTTTMSVENAGRLLGLGREASYTAARSGRLPTIQIHDRKWRVPRVAIEKMLLGE